MTTPTQVGWIDERGILFPLSSYNPDRASQYDGHKAGWKKAYTLDEGAQSVALAALTDEQIDEAAHELQRVIAFCGGEPSEFPYDYLRGILEKLPAAPAQQAGQGETEYCWLVELRSVVLTGGPYYHTGFTSLDGQSRSTKDPHKAKRYQTKEAAQLAALKLDHIAGTWEAVEHGFEKAPLPTHERAATAPGVDG